MTLNEAIRIAKEQCKDPYAKAYLDTIPNAIELGGALEGESAEHGMKVQILYALNNMKCWRGETARQVKSVLKNYVKGKK